MIPADTHRTLIDKFRQRQFYEQQRLRCQDVADGSARLASNRKTNNHKSLDLMSITRLLECCPREEPVVETCSLKFPSCHEPPAHAGIRPSERTPASLMFHARDSDPHNDTTSRLRGETACKSEWAVRKRLQSANGSLPLLSDNSSKFSSRKSLLITEKQAASAYFSTWSFRLCYCHGKNLQDVLSLFLDPATIVDLLHSNESSPPLKPSKEGFASFAVDGIGLLGASTPPRTKKR